MILLQENIEIAEILVIMINNYNKNEEKIRQLTS